MKKARPNTSRRTIVVNTASSMTTRVLQMTVLVWVNQHLLRHVDAAEYSLLPLVMSLIVFGELFRHLFAGALGRFIVEADARGDDAGVTRIVSSMVPVLLGAAAFLALLSGLAVWRVDTLLALEAAQLQPARVMLALMLGTLCVELIAAPFAQGLYVRQRFVALNAIELGCEALRATVVLGLLLGLRPSVMWVTVGSAAAAAVNLACRIAWTKRLMPAIRCDRSLFCGATARRLLRFGAWTSASGLTNLISTTAPALILNRAATALDVACFHLGRLPDLQLRRLAAAAAVPAQPALTNLQAIHGAGALHDLYYRGGRYQLWVTLLVVAPLVMFAHEIIRLYAGEGYATAARVMVPLLAVYPFIWANAMYYRVSHAIGRIGAFYACDLVVQLASLAALVYAVIGLDLGAPGAAMATALTRAVLHVVFVWPMGLRLVEGSWSRFLRQTLLPGLLPFVTALATCQVFKLFVSPNDWWQVGAGAGVAALAYVVVLLAFCLGPDDREIVGRVFPWLRQDPTAVPEGNLGKEVP